MSTNLHPPREIEELARGLAVSTLTKSYFRFASSTSSIFPSTLAPRFVFMSVSIFRFHLGFLFIEAMACPLLAI
jgi:hypothetical protein